MPKPSSGRIRSPRWSTTNGAARDLQRPTSLEAAVLWAVWAAALACGGRDESPISESSSRVTDTACPLRSAADERPFGPRQFVKASGGGVAQLEGFEVRIPTDRYTIRATAGDGGDLAAANTKVLLNGVEVLGPAEFRSIKSGGAIEKPVTVGASNLLSVLIKGKAGNFARIEILLDSDGDGVGNEYDLDDDGDGISDASDAARFVASGFSSCADPFAIPEQVWVYQPFATFPGHVDPIVYSITSGPAGMEIDPVSGEVRFTPPLSSAGQSISAVINASAGQASVEQSITIQIAALRVVASQTVEAAAGGVLAVNGTGTALDGMVVTIPPGALTNDQDVAIAIIENPPLAEPGQAPAGDAFTIQFQGHADTPLSVELPVPSSVPAGEAVLHAYASGFGNAVVDQAIRRLWLAIQGAPTAELGVINMTVCVSGYAYRLFRLALPTPAIANGVEVFGIGIPSAKAAEIASYVAEAKAYYGSLGYRTPALTPVFVHSLAGDPSAIPLLPWSIHMNSGWVLGQTPAELRANIAHEFFHVVQFENYLFCAAYSTHLTNTWITEATAVFMADEGPYDSLNYHLNYGFSLDFLSASLNAFFPQVHRYQAALFFKFLAVTRGLDVKRYWDAFGTPAAVQLLGINTSLAVLNGLLGGTLARDYLKFIHHYANVRTPAEIGETIFPNSEQPAAKILAAGETQRIAEPLPHMSGRVYRIDLRQNIHTVRIRAGGSARFLGEVYAAPYGVERGPLTGTPVLIGALDAANPELRRVKPGKVALLVNVINEDFALDGSITIDVDAPVTSVTGKVVTYDSLPQMAKLVVKVAEDPDFSATGQTLFDGTFELADIPALAGAVTVEAIANCLTVPSMPVTPNSESETTDVGMISVLGQRLTTLTSRMQNVIAPGDLSTTADDYLDVWTFFNGAGSFTITGFEPSLVFVDSSAPDLYFDPDRDILMPGRLAWEACVFGFTEWSLCVEFSTLYRNTQTLDAFLYRRGCGLIGPPVRIQANFYIPPEDKGDYFIR